MPTPRKPSQKPSLPKPPSYSFNFLHSSQSLVNQRLFIIFFCRCLCNSFLSLVVNTLCISVWIIRRALSSSCGRGRFSWWRWRKTRYIMDTDSKFSTKLLMVVGSTLDASAIFSCIMGVYFFVFFGEWIGLWEQNGSWRETDSRKSGVTKKRWGFEFEWLYEDD